jgi:hypothetical protein
MGSRTVRTRAVSRGVAAAAVLLVLTASTTASAKGINNLMAGINGLVTFPTDPVWSAVHPPEAFDGMFGSPVTPHVLGFAQGTLLMVYRAATGALDIAFFPFWVFPTLSPEVRYDFFNNYEVEYED